MVWEDIASNTRSPLILIHGTLAAYVHDILQRHVLQLMHWLSEAIFQQDNTQPHMTGGFEVFLCTATTFPWPSRSLDLSPFENIWDRLVRRVGHPTSFNKLETRLQKIWNEMSQAIIQNLYASMPDRITSCIRARGDSTGY
ncbi:transposable element Tcb1 transposase [Trichonephila clavipes]|nr:transposable element Tcb1 transposase [Trichonephila clavipes]